MKTPERFGLTLVELLVVIAIIGLLGGIIGLIAPRFAERSRVAQGSSQLRSWLLIAKQRALRDQAPRGVRFVAATTQNVAGSLPSALYSKFAYVEQPEDISAMPFEIAPATSDTQLQTLRRTFQQEVTNQLQIGANDAFNYSPAQRAKFLTHKTLIDPNVNSKGWKRLLWLKDKDLSAGHVINDNDIVEFAGARYSVIYKPIRIPGQTGSVLVLHRERDETRTALAQVNTLPLTACRITRLPRPIAGEPELTLPKNVAVDILYTNRYSPPSSSYPASTSTRSLPAPDVQDPPSSLAYDIMFTASGEITGQLVNRGRVVLWLRDTTLTDFGPGTIPEGENRLLVIHGRTGQVTSHPLNPTLDSNGKLMDVYSYVRDGKSSALEE